MGRVELLHRQTHRSDAIDGVAPSCNISVFTNVQSEKANSPDDQKGVQFPIKGEVESRSRSIVKDRYPNCILVLRRVG